jgi:hypothetical protein
MKSLLNGLPRPFQDYKVNISLRFVAKSAKSLQNPPKSAKIRQIVAFRCKSLRFGERWGKIRRFGELWGKIRRFGELWGTFLATFFERFIDPLLYI